MHRLIGLLLILIAGAPLQAADPFGTDPEPHPMFPPAIEELTFNSDDYRLSGLIYQANGLGPHPTVVLLHGLPGNEKNLDIAQVLRRAGFNVMFFHYRGAWGSEGDYSLLTLADDVVAALRFLRDNATRYRVDVNHLSLLGHSLGGWAALSAGRSDKALVCVGALAPANLGLMAEGIRAGEPGATEFLDYANTLFMLRGFDGAKMKRELLSQPALQLDIRVFGRGLRGKSLLLITGTEDTVVPPDSMFYPVVAALSRDPGMDLTHHAMPGDHAFSYSRIQLTERVLAWLERDCR